MGGRQWREEGGRTTTRKGRDHNDHNNDHIMITQHPPCHSEHLLAWGLWVLQRDDKGRGKDGDDNHDHNEDGKGKGTSRMAIISCSKVW